MISFYLPIKTVSEANTSEHWSASSKRHRNQQFFIRAIFNTQGKEIELPCRITLIRCASRLLDDDNLVSAFKWVRDEISECILLGHTNRRLRTPKGRMDCDPRIKWEYAQEKSKVQGVRIEIEPLPDTSQGQIDHE